MIKLQNSTKIKERFISGQHADFDYIAVDANVQMEDLNRIERDEEDAFFDSSDGDDLLMRQYPHV